MAEAEAGAGAEVKGRRAEGRDTSQQTGGQGKKSKDRKVEGAWAKTRSRKAEGKGKSSRQVAPGIYKAA